ncbi:MAG: NAD(P)/FAD-dependent oxidoreductase [Acidimicrobiia bacterium]
MRIAVIGSGVAGIGASWALSAGHHVTLFEAGERVGGHSRTLEIDIDGHLVNVDTGFIVYNERNYPNLVRFLDTLGVETEDSDMSFAVSTDDGAVEYGGRLGAMFSSPRAVADRRIWGIVAGIRRFRSEKARLDDGLVPSDISIADYLESRGYPEAFGDYYLLPLASAVWSGTRNNARDMPARTFLGFLDNHGLIRLTDRPQWRTVTGGSQTYVRRAIKEITAVHAVRGVSSVRRTPLGVEVTDVHGTTETFDQVVFATHADVTLDILGETATSEEAKILSAFRYDRNEVVLHTDSSAMPRRRNVWSAWNGIERSEDNGSRPVSVSYWMNLLQNIDTPSDLIVTLNPGSSIDPTKVIDRWITMHPQFDVHTDAAQKAVPSIQGLDRIWYAGAHLGYGFHEDGLQSGLTVAAALGAPAPWHNEVVPASTAAIHATPSQSRILA